MENILLYCKKNFHILIPILVVFIFGFSWFHKGLILGVGESGVASFYSPEYILKLTLHAWAAPAIGNVTSITVAGIPLYGFLAFLQNIHVPGFIMQAFVFIGVMFMSIIGFHVLFYKQLSSKISLLFISLFYLCNPVVIVLVWNRFQYPFIFFYGALPLVFGLFLQGIRLGSWKHILCLSLIMTLFSVAFSSIPLLELFWFLVGSYIVFSIFVEKERRNIFQKVLLVSLLLLTWVIFNAWWLFQFVNIFNATSYITTQAYSSNGDLDTFISLSNSLGNMSNVFRLIHPGFFNGISQVWGPIYSNPVMILISFLLPVLAFLPLIFSKKPKIIYYFLGISLIVLFFAKGANGPFGFFFLFFFSHFRVLEAFRNPFEKIGLILPFCYAPLIGYSTFVIYNWTIKKYGKNKSYLTIVSLGILIFVIYSFPLWNGWVFSSTSQPTNNLKIGDYVKVPTYYNQANIWLNNDKEEDFRVLALPMSGEGVTNNWEYGYTGVELSNGLFDKPFISFSTTIQFLDSITSQIEPIVINAPQYMSQLMAILNGKYVMIRHDINYKLSGVKDPNIIETYIKQNSSLIFSSSFGLLHFYKIMYFIPKVYIANQIFQSPLDMPLADVFSLTNFSPGDAIVNVPVQQPLIRQLKVAVITPTSVLDYSSYPQLTFDQSIQRMPYVRYLPGSKLYFLIRLKEFLDMMFITNNNENFLNYVSLEDKREMEFVQLTSQQKTTITQIAEKEYIHSINNLQNFIHNGGYGALQDNIDYFKQNIVSQRVILENALQATSSTNAKFIYDSLQHLQQFASSINLSYTFTPQIVKNLSANRIIYTFSVQENGSYEILLNIKNWKDFYLPLGESIPVQVNGQIFIMTPVSKNDWLSLGKMYLSKGTNEIQLQLPAMINLLNGRNDNITFTLESDKKQVSKNFPILNIDTSSNYKVTFDYYFEEGGSGKVSLDTPLRGSNSDVWSAGIGDDGYAHTYQNRNFIITPAKYTNMQNLLFTVSPYNTCDVLNDTIVGKYQCKNDKAYYDQFNKSTILHIKNLRVEKVFGNAVTLRLENKTATSRISSPTVSFQKINVSKYVVSIKQARSPFLLVFSEAYHPLWRAQFFDSHENIDTRDHLVANSYANAWYVRRTGSYKLVLEFLPEKVLTLGEWISIVSMIMSIVGLLIFLKKRKQ